MKGLVFLCVLVGWVGCVQAFTLPSAHLQLPIFHLQTGAYDLYPVFANSVSSYGQAFGQAVRWMELWRTSPIAQSPIAEIANKTLAEIVSVYVCIINRMPDKIEGHLTTHDQMAHRFAAATGLET